MLYCKFQFKDVVAWGYVEQHEIVEVTAPFDTWTPTGRRFLMGDVRLLAPVLPTTKLICVGLNYQDHIEEFGRTGTPAEPVLFLKAPSAIIGLDVPIRIPSFAGPVEYEAELGVVIGQEIKNVTETRAAEAILGCVAINDVTARAMQKKDGQWMRAKSFDTFAPIGPWIADGLPFGKLRVEAYLNGKVVQQGHTSQMIFSVPQIVSYVSKMMTLYPGDIISTGTPKGTGVLSDGDSVEVFVEGVGRIRNKVIIEK